MQSDPICCGSDMLSQITAVPKSLYVAEPASCQHHLRAGQYRLLYCMGLTLLPAWYPVPIRHGISLFRDLQHDLTGPLNELRDTVRCQLIVGYKCKIVELACHLFTHCALPVIKQVLYQRML